jgi:hypothetical protein
MKYVRLQYIGKKPSLHLTMARLKAEYTFEKGNEMTAPVEYGDAAYLLRTNMAIFKVVGGPFESESQPTLKGQEEQSVPEPTMMEKSPSGDKASVSLVGDNVVDEGPIPAIKDAEITPAPEEPKVTVKKGKK